MVSVFMRILLSSFVVFVSLGITSLLSFCCGSTPPGSAGNQVPSGAHVTEEKALSAEPDAPVDRIAELLVSLQEAHARSLDAILPGLGEDAYNAKVMQAESRGIPLDKLVVDFSHRGTIRGISGIDLAIPIIPTQPGSLTSLDYAIEFMSQYKELFGLSNPVAELVPRRTKTDDRGQTHVFFDQEINGMPIFGNGLVVHLTTANEFAGLGGLLLPVSGRSFNPPTLTMDEAVMIAEAFFPPSDILGVSRGELGIFDPETFRDNALEPVVVWKTTVRTQGPHEWKLFMVLPDPACDDIG